MVPEREKVGPKPPPDVVVDESGSGPTTGGAGVRGGRLNLNTADEASLELLPGVGPTMARRIVEHRKKHGPFRSVLDLDAVEGIGEKTIERLAPLLYVE